MVTIVDGKTWVNITELDHKPGVLPSKKLVMLTITPPELLSALRRIEARGAVDTTKRARIVAGQVFRYAVATGHAQRDPTPESRGAIAPTVKKHLAAIIDPKEAGNLLLAIENYVGTPVVRAALQLAPMVFVRPGELRTARWSEIDFEMAEWRIPAERMKTRQPHIVPLATQAVHILSDLKPLSGSFPFVFPSHRSPQRPMSENAVLVALRATGYPREIMTGHGFRALARTILAEVLNYRVDLIEHQLAHAVRDANGRAYNRTAHLDARKQMMQAWADYLVRLKEGAVSQWVRAHPATVAPAGSNRSSRGGDETAEAFGVEGHVSDLASAQAIT